MSGVVYDAGALIAADRGEREFWADHRLRLEAGVLPIVPAPVIAQVSRSGRQDHLRRLLRGCETIALTEQAPHAAGRLLGRVRVSDVVDAVVAAAAAARQADVVTGDRRDIQRLLDAAESSVRTIDA